MKQNEIDNLKERDSFYLKIAGDIITLEVQAISKNFIIACMVTDWAREELVYNKTLLLKNEYYISNPNPTSTIDYYIKQNLHVMQNPGNYHDCIKDLSMIIEFLLKREKEREDGKN